MSRHLDTAKCPCFSHSDLSDSLRDVCLHNLRSLLLSLQNILICSYACGYSRHGLIQICFSRLIPVTRNFLN